MTYTSQWLSKEVDTRSKELTAAVTPLKELTPELAHSLLQFSKKAQSTACNPQSWCQGRESLQKQMLTVSRQLLEKEKTVRKRLSKAQKAVTAAKSEATAQSASTRKAELEQCVAQLGDARFAFRMLAICFPVFELSSCLRRLEVAFASGEIELAYDRRQDARLLIARIRTAVQSLTRKALKSAPIGCTLLPSLIEQGRCGYWGNSLPTYVKPLNKPLGTIEQLAPNPRVEGPSNYRLRECRVEEIEVVDV